MRFSARIFAAFFLVITLFTGIFVPFVNAQEQNPYSFLMKTDSSVQMSIPVLTQEVFMGMLSTATCIVGGVDYASPNHHCLQYNTQTQTYSYAPELGGGLLTLAVGGIGLTYNKPFSTLDYVKYISSDFGLVKRVNAATGGGIGFAQLSPITNLWLTFRNLSYLIFVIIFVVIGFAIMLRAKIDPRTVMTIENQIPKLIVALILITFSFAIAGLMIDIMWVGVYLVLNLFASLDPQLKGQLTSMTLSATDNPFNWVNTINNGPLGFLGIAQQAAGGVKEIANVITFNIFQNAGFLKIFVLSILGMPILISCSAGAFAAGLGDAVKNVWVVGGVVQFFQGFSGLGGAGQSTSQGALQNLGACLDSGFATIISSVIGAVAFLIFGIALLVAIAKLWWKLIKAYVLFLIFVIFAPLIIMSGVIPGWTKTNFEWWLRHVAAYTIVFPTAMGIFLLGKTIMDVFSTQATSSPPLLGVGNGALAFFGPLGGFAIMMLGPQALEMVQDALNAPDPKYLASIGSSIGVGAAAYGSSVGKFWSRSFRESDPLRGLDEGWMRKLLVPQGSLRRRVFIGSDTGKANPLGGGSSH